jgi:hypothetical protein
MLRIVPPVRHLEENARLNQYLVGPEPPLAQVLLHERTNVQVPPPARPGQLPPADLGMIPLTIPEIARLLARPVLPGHAAYWLGWRRRHQARARWYHHRTRLARESSITLADHRRAPLRRWILAVD